MSQEIGLTKCRIGHGLCIEKGAIMHPPFHSDSFCSFSVRFVLYVSFPRPFKILAYIET